MTRPPEPRPTIVIGPSRHYCSDAALQEMIDSPHIPQRRKPAMRAELRLRLASAGSSPPEPSEDLVQLEFDLGALGLRLEPTAAMLAGEQQVFQHSWCGTIVVRSELAHAGPLGPCPSCTRPGDKWWQQQIGRDGLAGLRLIEAGDR